jgi:hypothetical protein
VPFAECTSGACDRDTIFKYYANHSSTSVPDPNSHFETLYAGLRFSGKLTYDTFHIAGLSVPSQPFLAADSANPLGFLYLWFSYEGVLGLAPRWNHTPSLPDFSPALPSPLVPDHQPLAA